MTPSGGSLYSDPPVPVPAAEAAWSPAGMSRWTSRRHSGDRRERLVNRQEPASSSTSTPASSAVSSDTVSAISSSSSSPLFVGGTQTQSNNSVPTGVSPSTSSSPPTNTFTSLWTITSGSQSVTEGGSGGPSSATASATYGPGQGTPSGTGSAPTPSPSLYDVTPGQPLQNGSNGLLVPLSLGGSSAQESIYSVPVVFGHLDINAIPPSNQARGIDVEDDEHISEADRPSQPSSSREPLGRSKTERRRRSSPGLEERAPDKSAQYQLMNLQVDLGSSDMWVAATTCSSSDCNGNVNLYDAGRAIDTNAYANLTYQSGGASGEIYWDQVQVGINVSTIEGSVNGTGFGGASGFSVSYQAFIAANSVTNEDLSGGSFSGVMGLALPANSLITQQVPAGTGSGPDGATYLDNLFGSGVTAPYGRYFSLSLERRDDSRTQSSLGFGMYNGAVCGSPCSPSFNSIVSASGGPLFWRLVLEGITVTTSNSPSSATSGISNVKHIPISMPASSTTTQSWPVAVLDSGGSNILFGNRDLLNRVYGVYGIGPSSDGKYYVPCKQDISVSFVFNSVAYPVHPLDMSSFWSGDQTHQMCLGTMQYASGLSAGDVILGSSFLVNAYSVFTYPSVGAGSRSWAPQVGLLSLTNATQASQEFYNVRSLNMPLSSSIGSTSNGGSSGNAGGSTSAQQAQEHHVASGSIIAVAVVLGILAMAAGLFCAWWFWLRRKYGKDGSAPTYETPEDSNSADPAVMARRSRKMRSMQRQKSMMDGYSDFDIDSWTGGTERDSESSETAPRRQSEDGTPPPSRSARSISVSNSARLSAWESSYPPTGWSPSSIIGASGASNRTSHRDKSPSVSSTKGLLYGAEPGPYPTVGTPQLYTSTTRQSILRRTPLTDGGESGYFDAIPMRSIRLVDSERRQDSVDLTKSPSLSERQFADAGADDLIESPHLIGGNGNISSP